jgi:hypothetical protein
VSGEPERLHPPSEFCHLGLIIFVQHLMLKYFFGFIKYLPLITDVNHSHPKSISDINMEMVIVIIDIIVLKTHFRQSYSVVSFINN